MMYGSINNTKVEEIKDLKTGYLLALVRNYEEGYQYTEEFIKRVYGELANRRIICL